MGTLCYVFVVEALCRVVFRLVIERCVISICVHWKNLGEVVKERVNWSTLPIYGSGRWIILSESWISIIWVDEWGYWNLWKPNFLFPSVHALFSSSSGIESHLVNHWQPFCNLYTWPFHTTVQNYCVIYFSTVQMLMC